MRPVAEVIKIEGELKLETAKAILFCVHSIAGVEQENQKEHWFPKSQLETFDQTSAECSKWILQQKELV